MRDRTIVSVSFLAFVAGSLVAQTAPSTRSATTLPAPVEAPPPWEVVKGEGFTIAVPRGWRRFDIPLGKFLFYLNGDGINVPLVDETGGPIQMGMTLERYGKTQGSALEGAKQNLGTLKFNPRLEVLAPGKPEPLKLSDGTPAAVFHVLLLKDRTRRSLQMKLFAKDRQSRGCVVSAWIVTGKDSKFIAKSPFVAKWLQAHMTSLCFDRSKFRTKELEAAYSAPTTQTTTAPRPATTSAPAPGPRTKPAGRPSRVTEE